MKIARNMCIKWVFILLTLLTSGATLVHGTAFAQEETFVKVGQINVPGGLNSFDIGFVDPHIGRYFLAEGDAGKRARDIDTATGRPAASPALAKSMRAFSEYRKLQCDFVRALYASSANADQGQLGCMIDITRRRVRELQPQN